MQHIRIIGRPTTYIFNYLFIYDIVVPKFKPQYHLNCQSRALISLGLVRGFSSVQSHRCKIFVKSTELFSCILEKAHCLFHPSTRIGSRMSILGSINMPPIPRRKSSKSFILGE
jgi:hypothetical protein